MRISAALALLTFCVGAVSAQQNVMRVVKVKGDASNLASVVCQSSEVRCRFNDSLRSIVLFGQPAQLDSIEQAIKELDSTSSSAQMVAGRNIESVVYVIAGSNQDLPAVQEVSGEALTPVVRQLRAVFPYGHFKLVTTLLLRSAEDSKVTSDGVLPDLTKVTENQRSNYYISYESARYSRDSVPFIHLKNFQFKATVQVPTANQILVSGINVAADLDLREGQKVVVGKANVLASDTCIFIVVSARLGP